MTVKVKKGGEEEEEAAAVKFPLSVIWLELMAGYSGSSFPQTSLT